MKKQVKFFTGITILVVIAVILLTISAVFFTKALEFMKSGSAGGVVGGFLALVMCFLLLAGSTLLSFINLPFTIISVKKSERRAYPIVLLIIEGIIILVALVLVIVLLINRK